MWSRLMRDFGGNRSSVGKVLKRSSAEAVLCQELGLIHPFYTICKYDIKNRREVLKKPAKKKKKKIRGKKRKLSGVEQSPFQFGPRRKSAATIRNLEQ